MFYLKTVDALLSCYPDTITEPELVLVYLCRYSF